MGVIDHRDRIDPVGLSDDDLRTWTFDALSDVVSRYAEPSIDFDLRTASVGGRQFIVIRVAEFAEVPTLCRRDYNDGDQVILREGACYVRPRRKPETIEVATYADMRDLIDLATEKGIRRFLSSAQRAGLRPESEVDHEAAFDAQAKEFE